VVRIEISGGAIAWMGDPEGVTFGVFSPAKGVH
jgi:predicted enzyme related to lactoylglutathione lyase